MKWLDRLLAMRDRMAEDAIYEGESLDEERVVEQFVFDAILDFIEREDHRLTVDLLDDDFDVSDAVVEWMDEQAGA